MIRLMIELEFVLLTDAEVLVLLNELVLKGEPIRNDPFVIIAKHLFGSFLDGLAAGSLVDEQVYDCLLDIVHLLFVRALILHFLVLSEGVENLGRLTVVTHEVIAVAADLQSVNHLRRDLTLAVDDENIGS